MKGGFFWKHQLITEKKNNPSPPIFPHCRKTSRGPKVTFWMRQQITVASLKIVLVADRRDRQLGEKDEAAGLQEFDCE